MILSHMEIEHIALAVTQDFAKYISHDSSETKRRIPRAIPIATLKGQGLIDPDIFISQSNELTQQLRTAKPKKEQLLATDDDNIFCEFNANTS